MNRLPTGIEKMKQKITASPLKVFMVFFSAAFLTVFTMDILASVRDGISGGIGAVLQVIVFAVWLVFSSVCAKSSQQTQPPEEEEHARQTGPDLVRVYAVCAVILIHGLLNCRYYSNPMAGETMFLFTVLRWALFPCVVLFFMLSGFFLRHKKLTLRWYGRLFGLGITYFAVTFAASVVENRGIHIKAWLSKAILYNYSAFFGQYIWLCLLIPFLNTCWNGLTDTGKQILCVTCVGLTSLAPSFRAMIPQIVLETYPVTFYFLGAYIADRKPKCNKKRLSICLAVWLLAVSAASFVFSRGEAFSWQFQAASGIGYQMFSNVVIATLIFLLLYDVKIRSKGVKKALAAISALSFEIYLFGLVSDNVWLFALRRTQEFCRLARVYPVMCVLSFLLSLSAASIYRLCYDAVKQLGKRQLKRIKK